MSCPPTHFRRSLTSPSVLKSTASSAAPDEGDRADLGRRRITRNSPREEAQDGAERGRRPARDESMQRGRRSVTAGPLGGSVARARERGSRTRSGAAGGDELALERWSLSVDLGATDDESLEAGWGSSSRDEVVGAAVNPDLLPLDLTDAYPSPGSPPSFPPRPLFGPTSYIGHPTPSSRRSSADPSHLPLVRPLGLPSPHPRPCAPPSSLDSVLDAFDSDWSPLFSPEHCTAAHVSLHGAGGGASPSFPSLSTSTASAQPRRLSYDVPDEYDAWDAAARYLDVVGAADVDEERASLDGRGACAVSVGRTAAARRRLEMVRLQLAG